MVAAAEPLLLAGDATPALIAAPLVPAPMGTRAELPPPERPDLLGVAADPLQRARHKLESFVARDEERAAAILRQWLQEDAAA